MRLKEDEGETKARVRRHAGRANDHSQPRPAPGQARLEDGILQDFSTKRRGLPLSFNLRRPRSAKLPGARSTDGRMMGVFGSIEAPAGA